MRQCTSSMLTGTRERVPCGTSRLSAAATYAVILAVGLLIAGCTGSTGSGAAGDNGDMSGRRSGSDQRGGGGMGSGSRY